MNTEFDPDRLERTRAYFGARATGIALLEEVRGASVDDLVQHAGATRVGAEELLGVRDLFFGATRYRGRQRRALASARRIGHDLAVLLVIAYHVGRARKQDDAWRIFEELAAIAADEEAMGRIARRKVREANPSPTRTPGVELRRGKDGLWSWKITADSAFIADLHANIDSVDDARAVLLGGGGAATPATTNAVMDISDFGRLLNDASSGAEDIAVQLTNGAVVSGAELVRRKLSEFGFVGLVDPVRGPVNLYRIERFASDKQRRLALIENPVCAWPDCLVGGDECQVHHIQAWERGGPTNMDNLVTLCPHHNGANDDAGCGGPASRGRMARVRGKTVWIPPR